MRTSLAIALIVSTPFCGFNAKAQGTPGVGTWETTLHARDLDNNGKTDAFYDSELNITWLADWGWNSRTPLSWPEARSWVEQFSFGGYAGWRLPFATDSEFPGCNFSYAGATDCGYNSKTVVGDIVFSELAHMYYITLGNKSPYEPVTENPVSDWGFRNSGPFSNTGNGTQYFWSSGQYIGREADAAIAFNMHAGNQTEEGLTATWNYIPVLNGDVAAVPESSTTVQLITGLLFWLGWKRVKDKQIGNRPSGA